ncbi:cadherin domain-containing protein [Levilinea saccharolytica]|uniref:cadherin domain-containing protein n=1 Tax=Levilinea saccharolytica TaxID=229921 RepID=UPI0007840FEC|nr:cadherin domain-containing protein [Levilinea saccharolytica]GAP18703.1 protein containing CHAP domain [Levilinea saccharolytica]
MHLSPLITKTLRILTACAVLSAGWITPAQAAPTQTARASFTLDGVELNLEAPFLPGPFTAADPDDSIQMATAVRLGDYQEVSLTVIPYGMRAPTEALPPAAAGQERDFRTALQDQHTQAGSSARRGPAARLFGRWVPGYFSVYDAPVAGLDPVQILMTEWVAEEGGRIWILRVGQRLDRTEDLAALLRPLGQFQLTSPDPSQPSTSAAAAQTPPAPVSPLPRVLTPESLFAAGDLPTPAWWHGECDLDYYKARGSKVASYPLGASYRNVKACGPRPYYDGVQDVVVYFFSGAHGELEWQCVELSMRYLYLAHNVPPYPGNGLAVVNNYAVYNPNGSLVKIANDTTGVAPVPGDVLSYGTTGVGHTSVVSASSVDASGNGTITIIEQNSSATGSKTLTVGGWHVYASTVVTGWLHDPYQITGLSLTPKTVAENLPAGTVVGTFTATDQNPNAVHTYTLVSGEGSEENIFFATQGSQLKTATALNFEVLSTYRIRVRVTNNSGDTYDKKFTITVTDANDPPSGITLTPASVLENRPAGTLVGTLSSTDEDAADTYTYALVSGTGSADNSSFTLSGNQLKTAVIFDAEARSQYSIRVRTTDAAGASFERALTVQIDNVSETPPQDVTLSASTFPENKVKGSLVGTFSTQDADLGETFTYSLVSGEGSADNASFTISGDQLKSAAVFDYETKAAYSLRVRVTDSGGQSLEKAFTLAITDTNDIPSPPSLSNLTLEENRPAGSLVGLFSAVDQDAGETFTFSLVPGTGSDDNANFSVSGNQLLSAQSFDFETKSSYKIRARVTDSGAAWFEKAFTVTILNRNDAPTDLTLSKASVAENKPIGTLVGTLAGVDPDSGDTFTYALVPGAGSTHNASFSLSGANLLTAAVFDYETQTQYSIRVRATDSGGLSVEKALTIAVTNKNEYAPTGVVLAPSSVAENQPAVTPVGTLSALDQDQGDSHTFKLVSGTGSEDNAAFTINGLSLRTARVLDFETKSQYKIRVRATDSGGLSVDQALIVTVTDANDAPTTVLLTNGSLPENTPAGAPIGTLSAADQDADDSFTFSLAAGEGGQDNAAFTLTGGQLRSAAVFDYESKTEYFVRIRAVDSGGAAVETPLRVQVLPVSEYPPTAVLLSNASLWENQPGDGSTVVGLLSAEDADLGETFTFALVPGPGDTCNARFAVQGGQLVSTDLFDFESEPSCEIRLAVQDSGGYSFEQSFVITILNRREIYFPFLSVTPP